MARVMVDKDGMAASKAGAPVVMVADDPGMGAMLVAPAQALRISLVRRWLQWPRPILTIALEVARSAAFLPRAPHHGVLPGLSAHRS